MAARDGIVACLETDIAFDAPEQLILPMTGMRAEEHELSHALVMVKARYIAHDKTKDLPPATSHSLPWSSLTGQLLEALEPGAHILSTHHVFITSGQPLG